MKIYHYSFINNKNNWSYLYSNSPIRHLNISGVSNDAIKYFDIRFSFIKNRSSQNIKYELIDFSASIDKS